VGKVLIVYYSLTGNTEIMADYIAEGIRISVHEAIVRKTSEISSKDELKGFDGYIFGSPTHHRDIAQPMKDFLFIPNREDMKGKLAGAFGSYTHSADAAPLIYNTMEHVLKMDMFELGPFHLEETNIITYEGRKACHDYGRVFGDDLTDLKE
jgi:flavodoxin